MKFRSPTDEPLHVALTTGHTCTIPPGSADDVFGQTTVEDGSDVLNIAVRCDRPDALARGARALIIEFDEDRQAYVVEPTADLGGDPAEGAAAT